MYTKVAVTRFRDSYRTVQGRFQEVSETGNAAMKSGVKKLTRCSYTCHDSKVLMHLPYQSNEKNKNHLGGHRSFQGNVEQQNNVISAH